MAVTNSYNILLLVITVLFVLQHDTTVASLLSALKLFDGISPAYSSAVMVELYSDPDDDK